MFHFCHLTPTPEVTDEEKCENKHKFGTGVGLFSTLSKVGVSLPLVKLTNHTSPRTVLSPMNYPQVRKKSSLLGPR